MRFIKYYDGTLDIDITKIERDKFAAYLNDGDSVLSIIDGELVQLITCDDNEDGTIDFIGLETQLAYRNLPFVYILH